MLHDEKTINYFIETLKEVNIVSFFIVNRSILWSVSQKLFLYVYDLAHRALHRHFMSLYFQQSHCIFNLDSLAFIFANQIVG